MTTVTDLDLNLIEVWQKTHSDVQPYKGNGLCVRMLIARHRRPGLCNAAASWLKDFPVPAMGRRTYCTRCLAGLIRYWRKAERGEVPA